MEELLLPNVLEILTTLDTLLLFWISIKPSLVGIKFLVLKSIYSKDLEVKLKTLSL
jgi:hypothetical protein